MIENAFRSNPLSCVFIFVNLALHCIVFINSARLRRFRLGTEPAVFVVPPNLSVGTESNFFAWPPTSKNSLYLIIFEVSVGTEPALFGK